MEKIQILFPEPQMRRLRELAAREDRPISEIVRRATEAWLDRAPAGRAQGPASLPTFHGGAIGVNAEDLREAAYDDRLKPTHLSGAAAAEPGKRPRPPRRKGR